MAPKELTISKKIPSTSNVTFLFPLVAPDEVLTSELVKVKFCVLGIELDKFLRNLVGKAKDDTKLKIKKHKVGSSLATPKQQVELEIETEFEDW